MTTVCPALNPCAESVVMVPYPVLLLYVNPDTVFVPVQYLTALALADINVCADVLELTPTFTVIDVPATDVIGNAVL